MPFAINVSLTIQADQTTTELLTSIASKLDAVLEQGKTIMLDLTNLLKAVSDETTVDNSIVTLLNQVVAQNKDLAAQLAAAIAANDPAAIAAVQKQLDDSATTLESNVSNIKAAITANTPAAPAA